MIKQGFAIGNRDWYCMVYYDVKHDDLNEVGETLLASGCPKIRVNEALNVLKGKNCGYTFTNFNDHLTIIVISETTSAEQMYDSIQHETRHAADHIGSFYDVTDNEELAYLQGEISRLMFPAAAMVVCPKCKH